ncbi:hypothetical protein FQZ97_954910 [compost metagenome]
MPALVFCAPDLAAVICAASSVRGSKSELNICQPVAVCGNNRPLPPSWKNIGAERNSMLPYLMTVLANRIFTAPPATEYSSAGLPSFFTGISNTPALPRPPSSFRPA